jgi:hypothetical protein
MDLDLYEYDRSAFAAQLAASQYGHSLGRELLAETCAYLASLNAASFNACAATLDNQMARYATA